MIPKSCVVLLVLVCFVGLGHAAEAPATRHLELALWYDGPRQDLDPLNEVVALFQKQHSDVLVHLAPRPTLEAFQKLRRWTGAEAGDAPDLVVINSSWLPTFASHLAPLDDLKQTAAAGKILPPVMDLLSVGGHLMAVPWCLGARVLLARADLMTDRHLAAPQTWDQVSLVTAPALHRPPQVWGIGLPCAASGGAPCCWRKCSGAQGENLIEPHGGVNLNTPGKIKALQQLCELAQSAQPEVVTWSQTELETAFGQGRLGLLVSDTWVARSWQKIPGAPRYAVLPLPGGDRPVADLLGDGLAVFADSKEKAEALAFAQMLLTSTAQKQLVAWGGIPVHQDLLAAAEQDPILGPIIPALAQAQGGAANTPRIVREALEYAIYLAVSGRQTPAEALKMAQKELAGSLTIAPGGPPG